MEYFIYGMLAGWTLHALWVYMVCPILHNVLNDYTNCSGDCNQGRNCDCCKNKSK